MRAPLASGDISAARQEGAVGTSQCLSVLRSWGLPDHDSWVAAEQRDREPPELSADREDESSFLQASLKPCTGIWPTIAGS